jgi:glycosyltransferase involved in cell wall biosynthesis
MKYVLDISCLDTYASGAKQRFLSLYSELIKNNKNKNFLIIYTSYLDVKKVFNFPNVSFKKNKFSQDNYLKKIISTLYIFFYLTFNSKNLKSVEYFTLPFFKVNNCLTVFTIHDLRRIYFSKSSIKKVAYKLFFKFFLNRASNIIVVSHAIKKEILNYFNKLKVTVIYNTIDLKLFKNISLKEINKVKKKYNLPSKFILSVGHQEKRKNYLRLIKSINILKKNNENINLVIVGQRADETRKINDLINKLKLNSNIKIFTNLNDFEVKCFYKLASLFVFPSTYEGFGIPILESMATNIPMVLSNTDVFREITQNRYIYFDPYDALSIASKIKYVLSDNSLKMRMVNYGKKRIHDFTLESQKKNIVKFYRNLS